MFFVLHVLVNIFFPFLRNTTVTRTTTVETILMNQKIAKSVLRITVFCVKMGTVYYCLRCAMARMIVEMPLMSI